LLSDDGTILGALKLIGPKQSRTRRIAPHVRYAPPGDAARSPAFGAGPKLDPLEPEEKAKILAALGQRPEDMTVVEALVGLVKGCSPAIARDIVALSGSEERERVIEGIAKLYGLL